MSRKFADKVFDKVFRRYQHKTSAFERYSDYVKIQHRCDPREFMDGRLKIVSSFTYILPRLRACGISKPVFHKDGIVAGQLIENEMSILDAGSRDGWVIEFLNSMGYKNVTGVELLKEYVDYCKNRGRDVSVGDLHKLDFKDKIFDFVYCRHVIEHCLDPVKVINELMRITKEGGAVYCSFPLEGYMCGKHTTAIPNMKAVRNILKKTPYNYEPIYIGKAADTRQIIPEGNEAVIFIIKKAPSK